MTLQLTTDQVWEAIEKESFAVIGMVTANSEARTVGIVYVVRDRKLYFGSFIDMWKVRHISANPHVSLTIPIDKRIPLLPWINIPSDNICNVENIRQSLPAIGIGVELGPYHDRICQGGLGNFTSVPPEQNLESGLLEIFQGQHFGRLMRMVHAITQPDHITSHFFEILKVVFIQFNKFMFGFGHRG